MPTTSIDSFFACTLIVIVVVVSMVATTQIVTPYMSSLQDLNEEEYLRKIVEHTLVSSGSPVNWGQNRSVTPEAFGLAEEDSLGYELDVDKVSRLNSQNSYALNYLEMYEALRLEKIALSFAFSSMSSMSLSPASLSAAASTTLRGVRSRARMPFKPRCRIAATRGRAEKGRVDGADLSPGLGAVSPSRLK